MTAIKHTTAVSNGKLSTSKMAVGESFHGEIIDLKEGKFGPIMVMKSGGNEVTIFPSGNLKYYVKDILDGKKEMGLVTITRLADAQVKGYPVTQFQVTAGELQTAGAIGSGLVAEAEQTIAEKLAAIRAKKMQKNA